MNTTTILVTFATGAAIVGVGILVTAGLLSDTYAALAIGAIGGAAGGGAAGFAAGKKTTVEPAP